ncbi:hypothetical protein [Cyclobacterium lianum]|uniref:hypothetical protein n=1 Tax=Cyclobacterium lianum TaxID=388280 RepID=UPI0015B760DC|nr:hypothetical protein [Cyclobacterium lianum]
MITNSFLATLLLFSSYLAGFNGEITRQHALYASIGYKKVKEKQRPAFHLENDYPMNLVIQEPAQWDLDVEGFSPAYFDKVRKAIAVNTVEQPTDQWSAATSVFALPSGTYNIRFISLLESDGECSYRLKIGGKKVMDFQNPRIYGKEIEEYVPHQEVADGIVIEKGTEVRVEFLPHSNGLVPEGEGFGFARARWKSNIEFVPTEEE